MPSLLRVLLLLPAVGLFGVHLLLVVVVVVVVVVVACGFCNRRGRVPRRFTRARRPAPSLYRAVCATASRDIPLISRGASVAFD